MKLTLFIATLFISMNLSAQTFYDFKVKTIEGEEISMAKFKGKKILVVNTASECGLTPQYETLEALYKKYGGDKFVIVGFPANNFAGQEPGSNKDIKSFCTKNYGVSFPMMEKISVAGDDINPLYKWLTKKDGNGMEDAKVTWNFQKFMIDENGKYVGHVAPREKPDCEKIINWVEGK